MYCLTWVLIYKVVRDVRSFFIPLFIFSLWVVAMMKALNVLKSIANLMNLIPWLNNNARVITFFCFHVVNNTKPMNMLMSIGKTCDVVNEYAYYNLKRVREYLIYFPLFLGRPCKISLVRQVQAYKALLWQSKNMSRWLKKGKKNDNGQSNKEYKRKPSSKI